jgi:hypothetical protein
MVLALLLGGIFDKTTAGVPQRHAWHKQYAALERLRRDG